MKKIVLSLFSLSLFALAGPLMNVEARTRISDDLFTKQTPVPVEQTDPVRQEPGRSEQQIEKDLQQLYETGVIPVVETLPVGAPSPQQPSSYNTLYGEWQRDARGWRFLCGGVYFQNGPYEINGKTYWFENGYMKTGWNLNWDNTISYYDSSGERLVARWLYLDGNWYFFGDDGLLQAGRYDAFGVPYYASPEGKLMYGWIRDGNNLYYADSSGRLAEGWKYLNGPDGAPHWYYFYTRYVPGGSSAQAVPYNMAHGVYVSTADGRYYLNDAGIWIPGV